MNDYLTVDVLIPRAEQGTLSSLYEGPAPTLLGELIEVSDYRYVGDYGFWPSDLIARSTREYPLTGILDLVGDVDELFAQFNKPNDIQVHIGTSHDDISSARAPSSHEHFDLVGYLHNELTGQHQGGTRQYSILPHSPYFYSQFSITQPGSEVADLKIMEKYQSLSVLDLASISSSSSTDQATTHSVAVFFRDETIYYLATAQLNEILRSFDEPIDSEEVALSRKTTLVHTMLARAPTHS